VGQGLSKKGEEPGKRGTLRECLKKSQKKPSEKEVERHRCRPSHRARGTGGGKIETQKKRQILTFKSKTKRDNQSAEKTLGVRKLKRK